MWRWRRLLAAEQEADGLHADRAAAAAALADAEAANRALADELAQLRAQLAAQQPANAPETQPRKASGPRKTAATEPGLERCEYEGGGVRCPCYLAPGRSMLTHFRRTHGLKYTEWKERQAARGDAPAGASLAAEYQSEGG